MTADKRERNRAAIIKYRSNPENKERERRRQKARLWALQQLAKRHPEEYEELRQKALGE